jgi:hypothetical protein
VRAGAAARPGSQPPARLARLDPLPPRPRPQDIVADALISNAQLETVVYANQRFGHRLLGGARAGFFLVRRPPPCCGGPGAQGAPWAPRQRWPAARPRSPPLRAARASRRPTPRPRPPTHRVPPVPGRRRRRGQGAPDRGADPRVLRDRRGARAVGLDQVGAPTPGGARWGRGAAGPPARRPGGCGATECAAARGAGRRLRTRTSMRARPQHPSPPAARPLRPPAAALRQDAQ